ncbi:hypothetical protein WJX84_003011 [Apatococcus fuscideae]|uniref:Uncharacterized protein n=1 Tax=Apatococcus fuscideae TaxID=2026836 RepID=A0AAW1TF36_9CHLO
MLAEMMTQAVEFERAEEAAAVKRAEEAAAALILQDDREQAALQQKREKAPRKMSRKGKSKAATGVAAGLVAGGCGNGRLRRYRAETKQVRRQLLADSATKKRNKLRKPVAMVVQMVVE